MLVAVLGGVFLKGFREAINLSVVVVGAYLLLNLIVVAVGLYQAVTNPQTIANWQAALFTNYGNPLLMIGVALLVFPRLALGVSGFETGVSVMPLVRGEEGDDPQHPAGRIRNTKKLLTSAALIMSFYLITTSFITVVLIPPKEFRAGGAANGRALAYLAHEYLGGAFGTVYDLSTIAILAFAGASAMAGLLNVVPRYLPRYGMAPEWGRAVRPLVLVYTAIAFAITVIFNANVDAQGGAYATGVLVIMTSAAFAVILSARRRGSQVGASRLQPCDAGLRLHHRSQRHRAPRRHQDRLLLHRFDHRRLARLSGAALARASAGAYRAGREGPEVRRGGEPRETRYTSSPTAAATLTTPKSTPGSSRSSASTTASQRTCRSCSWRSTWKTPRSSRRKCWR